MTTKAKAQAARVKKPMAVVQRSWELAAERGPDWLFVRLESGDDQACDSTHLAEAIWGMICEHRANRVVLELDRIDAVDEPLTVAIAEIGSRVRREGGLIRTCGLPHPGLKPFDKAPCSEVPHFGTRSEAVGTSGRRSGTCE